MPGYTTIYDNIVFIEGNDLDAKRLAPIKCDLSFKLGAQLKNLRDVKADMAVKARQMGANAVLDFKYGQKSRLLAMDDVAYFGSGIGAMLSREKFAEIQERIAKRDG